MRTYYVPLAIASFFCFAVLSPQLSLAAWPVDGRALCTAANDQSTPAIVTDGAGGAIVTWYDLRGGTAKDIYAQHVLASGAVDPAWPVDGRALCTAAADQINPTIIADGAGGAIVTWMDARSGPHWDIYAHHVLADGTLDVLWPADGRALCTATFHQQDPTIVPDGTGGAIVTWRDGRSVSDDIYAQHVLADGTVDAMWPVDGRALCTASANQMWPVIATDGAGGAIVTWQDERGGSNINDIYAQHVLASGAVDPAWPADGQALCTAANQQKYPAIVTDVTGGAIVTWQDDRDGNGFYDVYALRVRGDGTLAPGWPVDGQALCTGLCTLDNQGSLSIAADGASGAIVAWEDVRALATDIYAQHVLATGTVDAAWPVDGRALCTAASYQLDPVIVSDGAGGAVVTWYDLRSGVDNYDIYAQHVLASGQVDSAWPVDGCALSSAGGHQTAPAIATDGAGGAIVTWEDRRAGQADIYARNTAHCAPVLCNVVVSHDGMTPGAVFGGCCGNMPLDLILSESGIAVRLEAFATGAGNFFNLCRVDPPFSGFGSINVLRLNNIGLTYDLSGLAPPAAEVSFDYADLGGIENLQVNAAPLYVGELEFAPTGIAPGVTIAIKAVPITGGKRGTVTLTGPVQSFLVGGQEFWVDNVCARAAPVGVGGTSVEWALLGAVPNPGRGLSVSFSLPDGEPATLAVYDVSGREVSRLEVSGLGAGRHVVTLGAPGSLAPGIYLVRLSQGDRRRVVRAVVVQ